MAGFCVHCGQALDPRRALCPRCAKPASAAAPLGALAPTASMVAAVPVQIIGHPPAATQAAMPRMAEAALPIKTQPLEIARPETPGMPEPGVPEPVMSELVPTVPRGAPAQISRTAPMEAVPSPPVAGMPMTKSRAMTMVASEGLGLARAFNATLAHPFPGWRAELLEPPGPSTGGGAHATQHISIIGPAGNRLSIGRVDSVARIVWLRSHQVVDEIHRERFGHPFPITPDQYRQYLGIASHMLAGVGLVVQHEVPTPSVAPPGAVNRSLPPSSLGTSDDHNALWLLAVLGLAVVLALLIYWQM